MNTIVFDNLEFQILTFLFRNFGYTRVKDLEEHLKASNYLQIIKAILKMEQRNLVISSIVNKQKSIKLTSQAYYQYESLFYPQCLKTQKRNETKKTALARGIYASAAYNKLKIELYNSSKYLHIHGQKEFSPDDPLILQAKLANLFVTLDDPFTFYIMDTRKGHQYMLEQIEKIAKHMKYSTEIYKIVILAMNNHKAIIFHNKVAAYINQYPKIAQIKKRPAHKYGNNYTGRGLKDISVFNCDIPQLSITGEKYATTK